MNRYRKISTALKPLVEGVNPGKDPVPEAKWMYVTHEDHMRLLKDPKRCEELGLDWVYETLVYAHRRSKEF